jgi:hypothetical protein
MIHRAIFDTKSLVENEFVDFRLHIVFVLEIFHDALSKILCMKIDSYSKID